MKNGLSFEESKKPIDRDTANDKELQAAWVLKEYCAEQETGCPDCKFFSDSKYYPCSLLERPPEAWRLDDVAEVINGREHKDTQGG